MDSVKKKQQQINLVTKRQTDFNLFYKWKKKIYYVLQLKYCIEDNTWLHGDMKFIFECSNQYPTSERS